MNKKNGVVYCAGSLSRREFLRLGGAGLAGAALLVRAAVVEEEANPGTSSSPWAQTPQAPSTTS